MQQPILEAACLKVYINGQVLGWAANVQSAISTPARAIHGIDQSSPTEIIPTTYSVSCSIRVYRGRATGGAEGLGLISSGYNLLKQKYCTIEIVDRITDQVVNRFGSCLVSSQSWDISPKGLVTGTLSFTGIEFSTELG
jgi:hypothetical protein